MERLLVLQRQRDVPDRHLVASRCRIGAWTLGCMP
jgi:hypothetical protein